MNAIQQAVSSAKSLMDLRDALNGFDRGDSDERLEDIVDLAQLPTFGGTSPSDTTAVWSWDA